MKNLRHLIEEMQGDDGLELTPKHHAYVHGEYEGEYIPKRFHGRHVHGLLGSEYEDLGNGGYMRVRHPPHE